MEQKRDNAYFLQRLEKWPTIHADCIAGRITVAEARRRAGLLKQRTRLHELKNAWSKATADEQRDFLAWVRGSLPASSARSKAPVGRSVLGPDGRLLDWAKKAVDGAMKKRNIKSGQLSVELGLNPSNASVMNAIRSGTKLNPSTAAALDAWIQKTA